MDAETLLPHQLRVVEEKADLDKKMAALWAFICGANYPTLSEAERSRLLNQHRFMAGYSAVLGERIEAFN